MPLDKAIEHGKEHRKIYRGAKAIDCTCRNHGSCEYCKSARLYQSNKQKEKTEYKLKEFEEGEIDEFCDIT